MTQPAICLEMIYEDEPFLDRIGLVADVPGRHEPGTGELDSPDILVALDEAGYDRYVGFEYTAKGDGDRALTTIRKLVSE